MKGRAPEGQTQVENGLVVNRSLVTFIHQYPECVLLIALYSVFELFEDNAA